MTCIAGDDSTWATIRTEAFRDQGVHLGELSRGFQVVRQMALDGWSDDDIMAMDGWVKYGKVLHLGQSAP